MVVDHLLEHLPPQIPVLCMFLEKKSIIPYTSDSLISSLLRQMVQFKKSSLSPGLRDAYSDHKDGELPQQELQSLFKVIVTGQLIECANQMETIGRNRNI